MNTVLVCLGLVTIGVCGASCLADKAAPDTYYQWITGCLRLISEDMPKITASAEHAAKLFVERDYDIGAWGDPAFVSEFSGRAGGLMQVRGPKIHERDCSKTILLVAPRQSHLETDLRNAAKLQGSDCLLVLFARKEVSGLAKKLGLEFDFVVDTHAAEHGGLVKDCGGRWVIPTDRAASIAAMWAWTGEFVAACTHLGKMPTMWQSLSVPGADMRAARYRRLKFHKEKPEAIKPGKMGRDYLSAVSATLGAICTNELQHVEAAANQARSALASGSYFYVCGAGHATKFEPDVAFDPNVFTFLTEGRTGPQFRPGDFMLLVGYDEHWLDAQLGPVSRECRRLGGKLAWTLSTYGSPQIAGVERGETLIDQHWKLGDGVVSPPGYDISILPSSGVVAEAVLWMVTVRVIARR